MEVEPEGQMTDKSRARKISDEETVRRVQKGERELFAELVNRYQDMVLGMIMRQTGDAILSEELAHEVFIKAYTNIKSFRFNSRFSTWLVRIALNHSHSYYRTKRHKQSLRQESLSDLTLEVEDTSFSDTRELQVALGKYRRCISQLKPHLRETVLLCCLEGYSYDDAASLLKIPVGTVRSRLNSARRELRGLLEQEEAKSQQEVEDV